MYTSKTRIKVRYAETDQMGIVHHANYYVYFESAREDFIKNSGIKYKEMEDNGVMMPLIETYCKYYEGAKYADDLIVETSLEEITPVKVKLLYTVRREGDNTLIAKGKTTQAFVDKDSFRIVNLKKSHEEMWQALLKLK